MSLSNEFGSHSRASTVLGAEHASGRSRLHVACALSGSGKLIDVDGGRLAFSLPILSRSGDLLVDAVPFTHELAFFIGHVGAENLWIGLELPLAIRSDVAGASLFLVANLLMRLATSRLLDHELVVRGHH